MSATTGIATEFWMSSIVLNGMSTAVQTDLADVYSLHQRLARLFPSAEKLLEETGARVLFRVETPSGGDPRVLVQSPVEPDWRSMLASGYAQGVSVKKFDIGALQVGGEYLFRLVASPCRNAKPSDRLAGPAEIEELKKELLSDAYLEKNPDGAETASRIKCAWIQTRDGQRVGFSVLRTDGVRRNVGRRSRSSPVAVHGSGLKDWLQERMKDAAEILDVTERSRFVLTTACDHGPWVVSRIDGLLRIRDAESMADMLRRGINKGKFVGLGFMTIARAS